MKYSLLIFAFLMSNLIFAQQSSFLPKGFGIEIGLGYNQLHRHLPNPEGPFPLGSNGVKSDLYYEAFQLTPSVRFSYEIPIHINVNFTPFIEYSFIEAKSSDGYESNFSVHTLNLGFLPSYTYNHIQLAGGVRYNYFLKWHNKYAADDFVSYSIDAGFRLGYQINNILFSAEGWYNISTLSSPELRDIFEWNYSRYILLVGYRF